MFFLSNVKIYCPLNFYKRQYMMFKTKLFKITIFCLIPFICFSSIYFHLRHSDPPPLVSVVMPVYNRPDLVGRAITSILNQTMDNFELIIIDDGSDTLTKSILKQYAKQDDRIRLIYNPKNQGIAYSRQRGADAARGEYIAVMDSDDWSVPDRLEKSLAFMRDHPKVDVMTGGIQAIPKDVFIPDYSVSEKKGILLINYRDFMRWNRHLLICFGMCLHCINVLLL